MDDCFTPEKSQHWIALLGQATQSLSLPAGILAGDDPYITSQGFAVLRIALDRPEIRPSLER
jgi:hypothetical protein